ncbi:mitochondrial import inner membrane translocase subunit Tim13-like [Ostrea edulis]|uniref:Mitochondrial import inner membrane translocase subunit n=1 Tax=Ostrea edulis TaxID=37623 RepID=H6BDA1_OSTED|nr:mitochondrial import inner membrane translocase subunit Tim13-like [Ostrea edulis]AFA34433.1 TIMM13 Translocase of inner mitochondrial membrane [Ostrea edulis]
MDFSGSGAAKFDPSKREDYMNEVKQQLAIANAQELLQKISDKCFHKCITKPGTSLSHSENKCLAMCMDRYIDTQNLVAKAFGNRVQQEMSRM